MMGPYPVALVDNIITKVSPGVYILSRDGKTAHYVGRSDSDLCVRIKQSTKEGSGYLFLWYEYASSPRAAYRLECLWFHKYAPSDNTNHPAVPEGQNWRCPVQGCG
jgi:hypothetical protein